MMRVKVRFVVVEIKRKKQAQKKKSEIKMMGFENRLNVWGNH